MFIKILITFFLGFFYLQNSYADLTSKEITERTTVCKMYKLEFGYYAEYNLSSDTCKYVELSQSPCNDIFVSNDKGYCIADAAHVPLGSDLSSKEVRTRITNCEAYKAESNYSAKYNARFDTCKYYGSTQKPCNDIFVYSDNGWCVADGASVPVVDDDDIPVFENTEVYVYITHRDGNHSSVFLDNIKEVDIKSDSTLIIVVKLKNKNDDYITTDTGDDVVSVVSNNFNPATGSLDTTAVIKKSINHGNGMYTFHYYRPSLTSSMMKRFYFQIQFNHFFQIVGNIWINLSYRNKIHLINNDSGDGDTGGGDGDGDTGGGDGDGDTGGGDGDGDTGGGDGDGDTGGGDGDGDTGDGDGDTGGGDGDTGNIDNSVNYSALIKALGLNKKATTNNITAIKNNTNAINSNNTKIDSNIMALDRNSDKSASNTNAIYSNNTKIDGNTNAINSNNNVLGNNTNMLTRNGNLLSRNNSELSYNSDSTAYNTKILLDDGKITNENTDAIYNNTGSVLSNNSALSTNTNAIHGNTSAIVTNNSLLSANAKATSALTSAINNTDSDGAVKTKITGIFADFKDSLANNYTFKKSSSSCPTWTIPRGALFASGLVIDSHCVIATKISSLLSPIMLSVFTVLGFRVVFSA